MSDIKKQVTSLAGIVNQIRGLVHGKTRLSFPGDTDAIKDEESKLRVTNGMEFSDVIKSEVEGFVIKWSQEVDEVLSMESQKEIEEGKTPGPEIEIKFWQMRFANLQNLHDQLTSSSSKSMVNILKLTKSGYLVLFRLIST